VEGFRNRGEQVVIIEHDEHNDWLEACWAMGAVCCLAMPPTPTCCAKPVYTKRVVSWLCCNDDGINAEVAVRARA